MISYVDGEVTGVKWMDKRPVAVISTIHDSSMVTVNRRSRHAQGGVEALCKPVMINEYNKYMGGVDIADQLVTYYGFQHCSKKWWKRVFFHLLDVTMVNAFVIYKSSRHHKVTHLAFMVDVVKGLLQKSGTDLGIEGNFPGTMTPFGLIGRNHFPEPTGKKLDCCLCSNRRTKRKQSSYQCESCKVTLCIYPCFRNYHKYKNI